MFVSCGFNAYFLIGSFMHIPAGNFMHTSCRTYDSSYFVKVLQLFNTFITVISENFVSDAHMVLKGHRSIVNEVRFNPQNFIIASSGVEKIVKVCSESI